MYIYPQAKSGTKSVLLKQSLKAWIQIFFFFSTVFHLKVEEFSLPSCKESSTMNTFPKGISIK